MDIYDVEVLLDRLAAAMKARESAKEAKSAYEYRYSGCREDLDYERARHRLLESLTLLIHSETTLSHQSTEGQG